MNNGDGSPTIGRAEQEMIRGLAQTFLDALRGAYGLGFSVERGKAAAAHAATDVFMLQPLLEHFTPEGRKKLWQVALIEASSIVGAEPKVLVDAAVPLDRSAWKEPSAPMFGATILALATSPIARAFLYYEGYELRFRILTPVEKPAENDA